MPRTALTDRRSIQNDSYSIKWPTLGSPTNNATVTGSAEIAALGTTNLNYSAGIWLKESAVRATFGNIVFALRKNSPFKYAFQLRTSSSGKIGVGFYDGTLNPGVFTINSYSINTWHHLAFTREGTTVKVYYNGVLANTQTITVGDTTSDTLELANTSPAFAGNLSDAFVYGRVLTASEISSIYYNDVYPSGALFRAKLNEGTGSTAYDISGNNLNMTLNNITWSTDTVTGTRSITNILRRKPVGGNIVYNGDFEILPTTNTAMTTSGSTFIDGTAAGSSTDTTYGWYVYNFAGTRSAQFDTTTKYSGNGSLKLTTNAGSIGVAYCANVDNDASWSRNNLPCEPNTTYNLSVWVKTNAISGSATTGAAVIIAERNKTNATVSGGGKTIVTGIITTTDWTQYTTTITTQASTRFLNPQFQLVGNNGTATLNIEAWFDNLTITQAIPRREVDNLVFNGKFEYAPPFTAATTGSRWIDGTTAGSLTNSAYGWRLSVGAGTPSAQYDNTVYKNGVNSLKVTSGVGGWAEVVNGTTKDFFVPVLPSTSYTLSGWMKTEYISGDANIGAQMFAYEYTGAIVGGSLRTTTAVKTTTDWTQYSVTFTTASTARYVSIGNSIKGHTGTATLSMNAWYDDITLVKN